MLLPFNRSFNNFWHRFFIIIHGHIDMSSVFLFAQHQRCERNENQPTQNERKRKFSQNLERKRKNEITNEISLTISTRYWVLNKVFCI